MALERKYIRDKGYDVEDEFLDTLHEIDRELALDITLFIEHNVRDMVPNYLTTYVLGGLVYKDNSPVTFAVEIMKEKGSYATLTDLTFISMDEYLDLILEDSYIKPDNDYRINPRFRR
tara:strand:- start:890 stop:1243 length:354 start_codon:yes stop_codon:yes gene_type:complete